MTDETTVHGCTINGQPAMPILVSEYNQLVTDLASLRTIARGYCPHCGRGDAGPTTEDWEQQKQRADDTEQQLRLTDAMRQQNLDAAAAAVHRAEQAEAALARIQHLADEHPAGIDTALILEALDQPGPEAGMQS